MKYESIVREIPSEGITYYWCVMCGNHGKFDFPRTSQCKCQSCNYEPITAFTLEEIQESETLKEQFKSVLT